MLSHLRVIDLTHDLGTFAARILAELGAKVTHPNPDQITDGIAEADILIRESGDKRAFERPESLIEIVVTPFDETGPHATRPATDFTLQARSGLMHIVGDPDRPPLALPGEQAAMLAGTQAAIAALVALHRRAETGLGQRVMVSAYRSAVLANYREPLMWAAAGTVGRRTGNLLVRGKSGVRQVWRCRDGHVTWSIIDNPGMMRAMVGLMAAEDSAGPLADIDWEKILVADTPRETLELWESHVAAFLERHDRAWLAARSTELGFGLSSIDEPADVLESPHLAARGLWREMKDPETGQSVKRPGPLFLCEPPIGPREEPQ